MTGNGGSGGISCGQGLSALGGRMQSLRPWLPWAQMLQLSHPLEREREKGIRATAEG